MLDLHTGNPELRVDDTSPFELLDAAENLEAWDETTCTVADYLLNAWTLQACMNEDPEGLAELSTTLDALLDRLPNSAQLPSPWRDRWLGYHDLLNGRSLRFTSDKEIAALLARKHIPELLRELSSSSFLAQAELREREALQLGESRASQLLGQMEDHGLVQHRQRGKYKEWQLTPRGQALKELHRTQERKAAPPANDAGSFGFGSDYNSPAPRLLQAVVDEQEKEAA